MTLYVISMFFLSTAFSGIIESFPSKTQLLVKLDFEKFKTNEIVSDIRTKNPFFYEAMRQKFIAETGIDLEDVKTIWLGAIRKNNGIIVMEGNFDPGKIEKTVSGKPENEVVERSDCRFAVKYPDKHNSNRTSFGAVLDNNTIVAGTPELADEFVKNYSSKESAQDFARKKYLAGGKLLEGVILGVPQDVVAEKPFLADLDFGHFEIDMTDALNAELVLDMCDEEQADALKKIFEGILTLQKLMKNKQKVEGKGRKEFFDNLSIDQTGDKVVVKSKISVETLRAELEKKTNGGKNR